MKMLTKLMVAFVLTAFGASAAYACDGYLITDPVAGDPLLALLTEQRVPFLAVGRDPADPDLSGCLDTDNAATTVAVLDHLRGQGEWRPEVRAQWLARLTEYDPRPWAQVRISSVCRRRSSELPGTGNPATARTGPLPSGRKGGKRKRVNVASITKILRVGTPVKRHP